MLNDLSLYLRVWADFGVPLWHYIVCFFVVYGLYVAAATGYAVWRAKRSGWYHGPDYTVGLVVAGIMTWALGPAAFIIFVLLIVAAIVVVYCIIHRVVSWVASRTIDRAAHRYISNRKVMGDENAE